MKKGAHTENSLYFNCLISCICSSDKMSHKCDPCRFRNKSSNAIFLCETCMEYYCSRCRKQHLKFRLTMGHSVTEVGDKEESRKSGKFLSHDTGLHHDHSRYDMGNIESNSEFYDYEADILETKATRHCHMTGKCMVRVDSCGISITEIDNHVTLCWPYTCVRKYGSMDDKIFFFECGRRCVTGEGRFVLMIHNAIMLHKNMTNFIRRVEKKM